MIHVVTCSPCGPFATNRPWNLQSTVLALSPPLSSSPLSSSFQLNLEFSLFSFFLFHRWLLLFSFPFQAVDSLVANFLSFLSSTFSFDIMLVRSSSTPILGSLLLSSSSSFTDSPKHNLFSSSHSDKIPFTHSLGGHPICCNIPTYPSSCSSSPFDKESHNKSVGGFRRAQSDGNLEGLLAQEGIQLNSSRKSFRKGMLETIPSFSIYSKKELEDEEEEEEEEDLSLQRSVTIGENISMLGGGNEGDGFCFGKNMKFVMTQVKEDEEEGGEQPVSPSMFLACGLGIDLSGGGDFGGFNEFGMDKGKGDECDLGEYYQKMVEQDPSNPLFLRNYAQFLYQTMGDLPRAEEYYSRAILSDPGDGEVMSQYAKIVWELHRDLERASTYFERAVQVSPQDSHVHAAYASFLWETEDDDVEEGNLCQGLIEVPLFGSGVITSSVT